MGVIRGKHDPDFAEFSFLCILGNYRLSSFCLLCWYVSSIIEIRRFRKIPEGGEARTIGPFALVAVAVVSSCALYTRQFYAFLPAFAAYMVLPHTNTSRFVVFSVFFSGVAGSVPSLPLEGAQSADISRAISSEDDQYSGRGSHYWLFVDSTYYRGYPTIAG
jgi:hypothetical protein